MDEYIKRQDVLDEINEMISNIAFTSPYQDEIHIMVDGMERARYSVEDAPAADVVPVVRCKDCVHRKEAPHHDGLDCCPMWGAVGLNPWGFCNLGKPKEDKHG